MSASGFTRKRRILLVDDDGALLEAMEAALSTEFRVFPVADTVGADRVLASEAVDLVILDIVMREENGLSFLDRLRATSDVPVLLISGFGTKDLVIAGLRARASDYIDKPFTATDLLDRVRHLIGRGPSRGDIAARIRQFIQQHHARDWTIDGLAAALDVSVRTMRVVFRRRYQQSVMDFLEEARLARARDLLATTELPIRKIADQVGFRDPNYFSRVFRRQVGKSPRGFRIEQFQYSSGIRHTG